MTAEDVTAALAEFANADDAVFLQRFFKTGPGEYGEGDVFIGVRVPQTRSVCKRFKDLSLKEIDKLLASPVHEHRLAAVIIMSLQFAKSTEQEKHALYELYLSGVHQKRINNWDIVDVTANRIVGEYLLDKPKDPLFELAKSGNIWARRVSIVSTFAYTKRGDPAVSLELAELLFRDKHDLMQKAVGWVLREVGKVVDESLLTDFLDRHAHEMPRTELRYAIERLSPEKKAYYLKLKTSA